MKHTTRYLIFISLIVILFLPIILFPQSSKYHVKGKIDIGGGHRWDYLSVDTLNNKLFISHSNMVNVVNLSTNILIGEIKGLNHSHGVATVDEFEKGFISNGGNNTVTIFNLKTLKKIKDVPVTGKGPDAIVYDPFSKRIFTFNGGSGNATAIEAKTGKVAGTISLDGRPEFAVSNEKGKMFVNLEDKNAIEEFNPVTLKEIAKWSVTPGTNPSGLAIDRKNNILFSGCRNNMMVIVDANTGKVITHLPIGKGVDGCCFDPSDNLAFASCWDGTLTVISEESPQNFRVAYKVETMQGARTMTLNENTHDIYTSTMINKTNSKGNNFKIFGVLILSKK